MPLTVVFNSAISPLASTSIVSLRSPFATACTSQLGRLHRDGRSAIADLCDFCDAPDLTGQIGRKLVDDCRQVAPCSLDALHDCLPAQSAFCADFQGYTLDLDRKVLQSVHHRVDDVFELRHGLALDGHDDLLRQVSCSNRLCTHQYMPSGRSLAVQDDDDQPCRRVRYPGPAHGAMPAPSLPSLIQPAMGSCSIRLRLLRHPGTKVWIAVCASWRRGRSRTIRQRSRTWGWLNQWRRMGVIWRRSPS